LGEWSFLTSHARVLVCIANDPGVRPETVAENRTVGEVLRLSSTPQQWSPRNGQTEPPIKVAGLQPALDVPSLGS
jgi:hypothetical protein